MVSVGFADKIPKRSDFPPHRGYSSVKALLTGMLVASSTLRIPCRAAAFNDDCLIAYTTQSKQQSNDHLR